MFRAMRREKQAMSKEECLALLQSEVRGVLSVQGDDGYPYGVPINHWYCQEDGKLYFHGGRIGHKIDAMRNCDKVSFCVYDQGSRREGEWALNFRCVVLFGRVQFIEDYEKSMEIARQISKRFTDDKAYTENEIAHFGAATLCFSMEIEHMTGKRVNEA